MPSSLNYSITMFAYLVHHVRSAIKAIRDDTIIPAACFAVCNTALNEAQKVGKSDALCAPDSAFQVDLAACNQCIAANSVNATQTSIDPIFQPFIDFCDVQIATPITATGTSTLQIILIPPTSTADAAALFSQALASFSSQMSSLSSFAAYNATRTFTKGYTTTLFATPTVDLGGAITGSPSPTLISNPPSTQTHNWIAGAVMGPISLLSLIAFAIFLLRRRRRRISTPTHPETDYEEPTNRMADYKDKPQLHSDSIPRKELRNPAELPGQKVQIAELPAREPVGAELRGAG